MNSWVEATCSTSQSFVQRTAKTSENMEFPIASYCPGGRWGWTWMCSYDTCTTWLNHISISDRFSLYPGTTTLFLESETLQEILRLKHLSWNPRRWTIGLTGQCCFPRHEVPTCMGKGGNRQRWASVCPALLQLLFSRGLWCGWLWYHSVIMLPACVVYSIPVAVEGTATNYLLLPGWPLKLTQMMALSHCCLALPGTLVSCSEVIHVLQSASGPIYNDLHSMSYTPPGQAVASCARFAYPAEENFAGQIFPLRWSQKIASRQGSFADATLWETPPKP